MIDPLDVALGEIRPEDQAELTRRLREDRRFREEVERLAPVVARLEREPADIWDPPKPPPLVVGAPVQVKRRRRERFAFVLRPSVALAASVLLVLAGLGLGRFLSDDDPAGPARSTFVLSALPGEAGRAQIVAERGADSVRIVAQGLKPDARGTFHELWLLPADGEGAPVPVGRFRVDEDGRATATYRLPADPSRFALFDVSAEPADGDPQHSGHSILQAKTRS